MAADFVRRVTVVDFSSGESSTVFKSKKKRKVSRWLKPVEKSQRRMAQAAEVFGSEVLRRHKRSARKRKNGSLLDGWMNLMCAQRKAMKKLIKI